MGWCRGSRGETGGDTEEEEEEGQSLGGGNGGGVVGADRRKLERDGGAGLCEDQNQTLADVTFLNTKSKLLLCAFA